MENLILVRFFEADGMERPEGLQGLIGKLSLSDVSQSQRDSLQKWREKGDFHEKVQI